MQTPFIWIIVAAVTGAILWILVLQARRKFERGEQDLLNEKHQYRQVDTRDFASADIEFYDMTRDWLTRRGFALLGDIEDFSFAHRNPSLRHFYRVMVGDGAATVALLHHLNPRNALVALEMRMIGKGWDGRIVELSTELEDGIFIITSNASGILRPAQVDGIVCFMEPQTITLEKLVELHRDNVLQTIMGRNTRTRSRETLDSVIESLHRERELQKQARIQQVIASGNAANEETLPEGSFAKDAIPVREPGAPPRPPPPAEEEELDDGGNMELRWQHFCSFLRRTIDSSGVAYELLVAVPKHGSEIGIGRMRGERPYLCFKRPDEAGDIENFKPFYLEGASYDPPFSRIEGIVVGLDHNRVLYVLLEFLEENEGEERFTLSFDPDWDQPTILYLGADVDAGSPTPYDIRKHQ